MITSCIDCKIGVIALIDHATVMLDMIIGEEAVKSSRWRCNTSLFHDPGFKEMLDENLKSVFQINTGSTEKGKIIAYSSKKKKDNSTRVIMLES